MSEQLPRLPGASASEVARALSELPAPAKGAPPGLAPVTRQQGVVQSVQGNRLTISLGGSSVAVPGVRFLDSYSPAAGHVVEVLHMGSDILVIGRSA